MKKDELARLHKALSVPVRLEILSLVSARPLCVNAITRFLKISQPAVSQHLAVLRQAGLVWGQKSGYMVHYALNRARLQEFRRAMAGFPEKPVSTTFLKRRTSAESNQQRRESPSGGS
jgi:DNA-binding transcriptional ArsR family regulator